ncbi:hypothetical protein AB5J72_40615 [Streptomyces sp. CG1]|uniref:hypothetical protein n=1 Tax=Streptomyces sp. CG1 TaxID=1287523 RepID=UPI0034E28358
MSVFAHHPLHHSGTRSRSARQSMRALLAGILRRIADSPLEQPVLHALDVQATHRATAATPQQRPHAHWHLVSRPDGARHLEATWHTRH